MKNTSVSSLESSGPPGNTNLQPEFKDINNKKIGRESHQEQNWPRDFTEMRLGKKKARPMFRDKTTTKHFQGCVGMAPRTSMTSTVNNLSL